MPEHKHGVAIKLMKLSKNIKGNKPVVAVLNALGERFHDDYQYVTYDWIATRTGIDRKRVRKAVRYLVRNELAEHSTLFSDCDMKVCGSGHAMTAMGHTVAQLIAP